MVLRHIRGTINFTLNKIVRGFEGILEGLGSAPCIEHSLTVARDRRRRM